jgi:cytochrome c oxidase subunit 3
MAELLIARPEKLPVGPIGRHGMAQWGVGALIVSEAALFGYLLFSYYYIGASVPRGWLLEPHPAMWPALPNTILLLASSVAAWFGEKGVERGGRAQALTGLGGAFVMGAVFAGVQVYEWTIKSYHLRTSSYASLYFTTTGLHLAHVIVGLLILGVMALWVALDYFSPRRRIVVSAGILYWHFVDAVWLFVFVTYYLTPYLGFGR